MKNIFNSYYEIKTEHELNGELKVEGLPVDNVDNALYKVYPKWVSYPHWPWRNYSYSNFKFTILRIKRENIQ